MKKLFLLISMCYAVNTYSQLDMAYDGDIHTLLYQGEEFFITLAARETESLTDVGHAFIILESRNRDGSTNTKGIGFYPNLAMGSSSSSPENLIKFFAGPGVLNEEWIKDLKIPKDTKLRLRIDKYHMEAVLKKMNDWGNGKKIYSLGIQDCTTFVQEIGEAMGIKMPARTIFNMTPAAYLKTVVAQTRYPNYLSIGYRKFSTKGQNGFFFGNQTQFNESFTGMYKYQDPNTNTCYEGYYENGREAGPMYTIYPNGDVWLFDVVVKPNSTIFFNDGRFATGYSPEDARFNGRLTYPNGKYYVGDLNKFGQEDGLGVLYETDGRYYYSRFENGIWQNYVPVYYNGAYWSGQLKQGWFYGSGTLTFMNGDVYTGSFGYLNNTYEGAGRYKFQSGLTYEGNFQSGKLNEGKITFPNGDTYVGGMSNWNMNGRGTYTSKATNTSGTGNFDNNTPTADTRGNFDKVRLNDVKGDKPNKNDNDKAVEVHMTKDGKRIETVIHEGFEFQSTKKVN